MTSEHPTPVLSALPPPRNSWRRAVALAVAAVYGPHLLMGLCTLLAASCEHCRVTVWKLLVIAPGVELAVLPAMLFRFHLPTNNDAVTLMIASGLSLLVLAGVAGLLRRWSRWRWLVFTVTALVSTAGAFLLLAMIRA